MAQRWVHYRPTDREGTWVKPSKDGKRGHWRKGGSVRGHWRQHRQRPGCGGKNHDPDAGELVDMAISLLKDPTALSDPLAWTELLGYLSPSLRRVLAFALLLPSSTIGAVAATLIGQVPASPIAVALSAGSGAALPMVLIALWVLYRQRQERGRSS